jgi:hypothetical protein
MNIATMKNNQSHIHGEELPVFMKFPIQYVSPSPAEKALLEARRVLGSHQNAPGIPAEFVT